MMNRPFEQRAIAIEDLDSLLDRQRGPAGKCCLRRRDGRIDHCGRRKRYTRDDRAVAGTVDIEGRIITGDKLAADVVLNFWVFHAGPGDGDTNLKLQPKVLCGKGLADVAWRQ